MKRMLELRMISPISEITDADRELYEYYKECKHFYSNFTKEEADYWIKETKESNSFVKYSIACQCNLSDKRKVKTAYSFITDFILRFGIRIEYARVLWEAHFTIEELQPDKLKEINVNYLNWDTAVNYIVWAKDTDIKKERIIKACEYAIAHFSEQEKYNVQFLHYNLSYAWKSIGDMDKADRYAFLALVPDRESEIPQTTAKKYYMPPTTAQKFAPKQSNGAYETPPISGPAPALPKKTKPKKVSVRPPEPAPAQPKKVVPNPPKTVVISSPSPSPERAPIRSAQPEESDNNKRSSEDSPESTAKRQRIVDPPENFYEEIVKETKANRHKFITRLLNGKCKEIMNCIEHVSHEGGYGTGVPIKPDFGYVLNGEMESIVETLVKKIESWPGNFKVHSETENGSTNIFVTWIE
jgi:hypothetical protein